MSSTVLTPSFKASAAIAKMRFVKISGDFTVAQCGAGEVAFGVSSEGTAVAPLPNASTNAAEIDGLVRIYGPGETALIEVAAAVTAGQFVKPDANAKAVVAASTNQYSGQVLQGQATVGGRALIFVCRGVAP